MGSHWYEEPTQEVYACLCKDCGHEWDHEPEPTDVDGQVSYTRPFDCPVCESDNIVWEMDEVVLR